jgi:hypothetical protein
MRIRDGKKFGSEIRDKHPGSATLAYSNLEVKNSCVLTYLSDTGTFRTCFLVAKQDFKQMKISLGRDWIRTGPFRLPGHFPGELVHKECCTAAIIAVL